MNEPVIACRGVSKRYGKHLALAELDLDVQGGEVFGFLGPNGAGKTTLIKMLVGLSMPTGGEIRVFGEDLLNRRDRAIRHLGAVVEAPVFFDYLSGWDNLRFLTRLGGKVTDEELRRTLAIVGLGQAAKVKLRAYSYGMRQRLGIAQALLPASKLLILDEPTNGLDPHGIAGVRALIRMLARERGITVFLSSHLLSEVEQLCDRVAIIDHGRRIVEGTLPELLHGAAELRVKVMATEAAEGHLRQLGATACTARDGCLLATFPLDGDAVPALVRQLVAHDLQVVEVRPHLPRLEDIFIKHTMQGEFHGRADTIRIEEAAG